MIRRFFALLILPFILTSCVPDEGLKRSANNQLFDTKGFHGGKRRPLYNNKYIDKAKHNVARSEMDLDEFDEDEQYLGNLNPAIKNRYMYEDMVEEDLKSEKALRAKKRAAYLRKMENRDRYYDLGSARDRVRESRNGEENRELRRELQEIKSMLDSAREDLVKYRCPVDEDGEIIIKKHGANPQKIQEEVRAEKKNPPKKPAPKPAPKPKKQEPAKPKEEAPAVSKPKPVAPKPAPKVVSKPKPVPIPAPKPVVQNVSPKPAAPKPASVQPVPATAAAPVNPVPTQSAMTASEPPQTELAAPAPANIPSAAEQGQTPISAPTTEVMMPVASEPAIPQPEAVNQMSSKMEQNDPEAGNSVDNGLPEIFEEDYPDETDISEPIYNEQSVPSLPQFPVTE